MIVLFIFAGLTAISCLGIFLLRDSDFGLFSSICAASVFAIALVVLACILLIAKPVSRHNCAKWGQKNERVTRFVEYNPYSWDCLTPTSDGNWLPTSQLRDITP